MLITALMGALLAIGPHYVEAEDGTTRLDTNVIQGLDLAGGARILIEPDLSDVPYEERQSTIEQTIRTLRTRVDAYGLEDMTIRPVSSLTADQNFIQMEMAGATTEELREIVDREGIFKASLSMEAEDGDLILLGGSEFELEGRNESIVLGNTEIGVGEEKDVEGSEYSVPVEFVNLTDEGRYNLRLVAYKGEDITGVDIDPSRSGVGREQNGNFPFQFQVSIDRSAAERFRDLAQNFDAGGVSPGEDTTYLEGTQLVLILDNEVISSLNVASVFRDQVITEPSISGGEPTREEAYELLKKYVKNDSQIKHALAVEAVMVHFAEKFGEDPEKWSVIGLVHDLDYELHPEEHCQWVRKYLTEENWPEEYIRAIESHGWKICTDVEPKETMEKVLYTIDELTGLIAATALVRPSKSIMDVKVKSVKKKWKQKEFAAAIDREVIEKGIEMLGMDTSEVIQETINGMQKVADKLGLKGNA